jgi:hypothetical protein
MDYKFLCFKGEPKYIIVEDHEEHKVNVYDLEWNQLPMSFTRGNISFPIKKPKNLNKMIELTRKLAKGFPLVRVDFYHVNDKVYFSELTFTPSNGMMNIKPKEYANIWGDHIDLETYNTLE